MPRSSGLASEPSMNNSGISTNSGTYTRKGCYHRCTAMFLAPQRTSTQTESVAALVCSYTQQPQRPRRLLSRDIVRQQMFRGWRRLVAAMENASLPTDKCINVTASLMDDDLALYLAHIRDHALKVIYIIIGAVGVLDNLFVITVFVLFIRITDKVRTA